jgi:hypothetical protein
VRSFIQRFLDVRELLLEGELPTTRVGGYIDADEYDPGSGHAAVGYCMSSAGVRGLTALCEPHS